MDNYRVPDNLSWEMMEKEFGKAAVDRYRMRILRRIEQGHHYYDVKKAVYIFMCEDRDQHKGLWLPDSVYRNGSRYRNSR